MYTENIHLYPYRMIKLPVCFDVRRMYCPSEIRTSSTGGPGRGKNRNTSNNRTENSACTEKTTCYTSWHWHEYRGGNTIEQTLVGQCPSINVRGGSIVAGSFAINCFREALKVVAGWATGSGGTAWRDISWSFSRKGNLMISSLKETAIKEDIMQLQG